MRSMTAELFQSDGQITAAFRSFAKTPKICLPLVTIRTGNNINTGKYGGSYYIMDTIQRMFFYIRLWQKRKN